MADTAQRTNVADASLRRIARESTAESPTSARPAEDPSLFLVGITRRSDEAFPGDERWWSPASAVLGDQAQRA